MISLDPFSLVGVRAYKWSFRCHCTVLVEDVEALFERVKWAAIIKKMGRGEEVMR